MGFHVIRFFFISSCPVVIITNFISDLMKSKPISLNMVIFVMFISRSISTLVNQEDSPTLSKTYLSGPISTSSQDHLQDHQEYLRTISRTIIRTISGPQDFQDLRSRPGRIYSSLTPSGIHGQSNVFPCP